MTSWLRLRASLALALVAGLAAPSVDAAGTRIQYWEFPRIPSPEDATDRFSWIDSRLESFRAAHPDVDVQVTRLTWKAGQEKLRIALFAGRPPDVISGALDASLLDGGHLEPVEPALVEEDRADLLPGALRAFEARGQVWGWPWSRTGSFLFLNLDALEQAGVPAPADGRFTRQGFRDACDALAAARRRSPNQPHPLGVAFSPGKAGELAFLLDDETHGIDDQGRPSVRGLDAAVDRVRTWIDAGWVPREAAGFTPRDLWSAFAKDQQVAMAPFGLWAVKGLRVHAEFRWGIAELPATGPREPLRPAATVGFMVLSRHGRTAAEADAAQRLARHLSRAQADLAAYTQFPTRRSAGDLYPDDPQMRRAGTLLASSSPLPVHPEWGDVDEALKRWVQQGLQAPPGGGLGLDQLEADLTGLVEPPRAARPVPAAVQGVAGLATLAALVLALGLALSLGREVPARLALAGPGLTLLTLFVALPAVVGLALAFLEVRPGQAGLQSWVGLDNFHRALADVRFQVGCWNTVLYAAVTVPANLATGLVLACLIHPLSLRLRAVFRGAFYLPGVASVVALALVWRQLLHGSGLIERALAPGTLAGDLARAMVPCLQRVPAALAAVFGAWVLATLVEALAARRARAWGGDLEPGRRRVRRDQALGLVALGSLLWVLAGWGGGAAGEPGRPLGLLTTPELSFWSVMLMVIVRGPGGALLVYLAALEAVPPSLEEAAVADGASWAQRFYHVTLPALAPTTLFLAMTGVIDSFQAFGQVFLLTDGGPGYSSTVVVHRMYLAAFRNLDFGLAAAQGMLLFAAVAVVGGGQVLAGRERA